jgi:hypothetical protein
MSPVLNDYYRCPPDGTGFTLAGQLSDTAGYFRFGGDTICYGRSSSGFRARQPTGRLDDVLGDTPLEESTPRLPFDPAQVIDNLRFERYAVDFNRGSGTHLARTFLGNAYYLVRPLMPVSVRRHLQARYLRGWDEIAFPAWPVDCTVERILEKLLVISMKAQGVAELPFIWFWPDGAASCAMVTHDVETSSGRDFCSELMDLNDSFGVKASFQIVPEQRYSVSEEFLERIRGRGFEINIHDLNHDGRLFSDSKEFVRRAGRINRYATRYGAAGFRSGALYRNADWYQALDFAYDMSIPNVAHLDPQRGGCCTAMPFFIGKILELPLTTIQDYSLFHILNQYSIELWERQNAMIAETHGLASFLIHPDYIREQRALESYKALLAYLARLRSERRLWVALPREVNQWWRERSQMRLSRHGEGWEIEGPGKDRARIAYAKLEGSGVVYHVGAPASQ